MGPNTLNCVTYRLTYSDGTHKDMGFGSKAEAHWYAHNEGDRLVRFERKNNG